jgi:hypothetical protein
LEMLDRVIGSKWKRLDKNITLGGDASYQDEQFIQGLRERKVAPHIHEYVKGNLDKNCLTKRERNDKRRAISHHKRKLIEKSFGWGKFNQSLRQVKLRGLHRVDWVLPARHDRLQSDADVPAHPGSSRRHLGRRVSGPGQHVRNDEKKTNKTPHLTSPETQMNEKRTQSKEN